MLKNDDEEWTVSKLRLLLGKHITALEMAGGDSRITQAQLIDIHQKKADTLIIPGQPQEVC